METRRHDHGDGLSQDAPLRPVHRSTVTPSDAPRLYGTDPASKRTRGMYAALSASSVGLELGLSVLIALLFGIWLDGKLGTQPWMMLLFIAIGCAAGFRGVLRAVKRADKAAERG